MASTDIADMYAEQDIINLSYTILLREHVSDGCSNLWRTWIIIRVWRGFSRKFRFAYYEKIAGAFAVSYQPPHGRYILLNIIYVK